VAAVREGAVDGEAAERERATGRVFCVCVSCEEEVVRLWLERERWKQDDTSGLVSWSVYASEEKI